ncbi:Nse4 C-terminal-domain-containing protein [Gautieria morchelliformis]|nr:Nse4 C-terminal-domain-containing protein [Gautieria morchelliformis]
MARDSSPPEAIEDPNQRHDLPYDPHQDIEEKRQIRRSYRALLEETSELQADIKNVKVSDIEDGLAKGNKLFDKVKDTSEATLDSRYLIMASDMGAAKAKAMKNDAGGFDLDDFVSKLVTYMGQHEDEEEEDDEDDEDEDEPLNWEKVGRLTLAKSHRVPVIDFMLGPLSTEQKQRKKNQRAKFEKDKEPERKPQELTEEDIQRAENETTKNVAMIEKILRLQTGPTNLFRFIVNPGDFGQTVENLFYVSFLIREGKCAFEFTEGTQEPIIYSCKRPTEEDYNDGARKQQIVMELDMETWKRAIEVFNIRTCVIPNREVLKQKNGQWVG